MHNTITQCNSHQAHELWFIVRSHNKHHTERQAVRTIAEGNGRLLLSDVLKFGEWSYRRIPHCTAIGLKTTHLDGYHESVHVPSIEHIAQALGTGKLSEPARIVSIFDRIMWAKGESFDESFLAAALWGHLFILPISNARAPLLLDPPRECR